LIGMALWGFLMLAYFIVWELAERSPLLDLRLFARRNFAIGSIMLSVSFMMMYGLLSVLLVRLQVVASYTSFLAGSVLLPLVFLAKPMASVMHRIVHRFDARLLVCINMLLFAVYCYWISRYDFFRARRLVYSAFVVAGVGGLLSGRIVRAADHAVSFRPDAETANPGGGTGRHAAGVGRQRRLTAIRLVVGAAHRLPPKPVDRKFFAT
jgi:hypothetical protein